MNPHRYCVIMCGGVGSRFWPFSRTEKPKQFLDFFGTGSTLLQLTVDRVRRLVDPTRIVIVTNTAYEGLVREQLPEILPDNILLEPARRNTAPCLCWAAHHIYAKDSEASIIALPSDHLVMKESVFQSTLEEGLEFVEGGDRLLTLGIKPTSPATGYGYIQRGREVADSHGICKVKSFTEKPNEEMARVFISTGEFFWNAGIFLWRADSILKAFDRYAPEVASVFRRGEKYYDTPSENEFIKDSFPSTPSISIDYAIMENADNVYVKTCDIGWSDVGSWQALYDCSPHNADGNVTQNCKALLRDCKNSIVAVNGDKLVVAYGLKDYIVAENGNTLLIYPIEEEQNIRHVVNEVKERFGNRYV